MAISPKCIIFALIFTVSVFLVYVLATDTIRMKMDLPQRINASFRLFETQNMWMHLLLDTRNGRVWQVSFSVNAEGLNGNVNIIVT